MTTFANSRGVAAKQSNGVSIVFPDVCKTPIPILGPVPIPYPNIATSNEKTAPTKTKVTTKQPVVMESAPTKQVVREMDQSDPVFHSLDVRRGGQLNIRQYGGKEPVTKVTYRDTSGREVTLQEPTLIELANGEYCAVCVAKGKVTAIYRLVSVTPKSE